MKSAYLYAIFYFALMALMLLMSGVWLFIEKIGFDAASVITYYAGEPSSGLAPKSLYGQLETAVPHLGATGLFVMVTMHFLIFAPVTRRNHLIPVALIAFGAALLNIASGMLVSQGHDGFAYLKLAGFTCMSLAMLYAVGLIMTEAFRTLRHKRFS
jgi:hypothetical protein